MEIPDYILSIKPERGTVGMRQSENKGKLLEVKSITGKIRRGKEFNFRGSSGKENKKPRKRRGEIKAAERIC
jgi:hypothetical protein